MSHIVILLSCLAGISCISLVFGCSCIDESLETKFCNAKFAIKGKVLNLRYQGMNVIYTVENLYSLKGRENAQLKIQSSKEFAMCGQRFEQGKIYLMTGTKTKYGAYETNNCSWNSLWTDLPLTTRTALERGKFTTCPYVPPVKKG